MCLDEAYGMTTKLFGFMHFLFLWRTAFDDEVAALQVVLAQLHCPLNGFTRAAVFCDSKAPIFAVNSNSTPASSNILDCKKTAAEFI
ncbi:hypothetical protein TNCV_1249881 [Trichonephila clavipes]|nr:hypothetical protein TNCV_1249881 [Trichonephila clavipes]